MEETKSILHSETLDLGLPGGVPWPSSVVQWHPFFFPFFFLGGCPTKISLPKKRVPFCSRVTEQLSFWNPSVLETRGLFIRTDGGKSLLRHECVTESKLARASVAGLPVAGT